MYLKSHVQLLGKSSTDALGCTRSALYTGGSAFPACYSVKSSERESTGALDTSSSDHTSRSTAQTPPSGPQEAGHLPRRDEPRYFTTPSEKTKSPSSVLQKHILSLMLLPIFWNLLETISCRILAHLPRFSETRCLSQHNQPGFRRRSLSSHLLLYTRGAMGSPTVVTYRNRGRHLEILR